MNNAYCPLLGETIINMRLQDEESRTQLQMTHYLHSHHLQVDDFKDNLMNSENRCWSLQWSQIINIIFFTRLSLFTDVSQRHTHFCPSLFFVLKISCQKSFLEKNISQKLTYIWVVGNYTPQNTLSVPSKKLFP